MSAAEAQPQVNNNVEPGNLSPELSVQENIENFGSFIENGGVPSADQVEAAYEYAKQNVVTKTLKGRDGKSQLFYFDKEGNQLDRETATAFEADSKPEHWILSKANKKEIKALLKTNSVDELSSDQKKNLQEVHDSRNTGKPLSSTYKHLKREATATLDLSNELKARKNRRGMHIVPNPKTKAEELGIEDLVDVNAAGREITPQNKWFISDENLKEAANWQDYIRENAPELPVDLVPVEPVRGLATRPDGTLLSKEEAEMIKANEDLIRSQLPEYENSKNDLKLDFDQAYVDFLSRVDDAIDNGKWLTDEEIVKLGSNLTEQYRKILASRGLSENSEAYKRDMDLFNANLMKQADRLDEYNNKMTDLTKEYFDSLKNIHEQVNAKIAGRNRLTRKELNAYIDEFYDKFDALAEAKGWEEDSDEYKKALKEVDDQIDSAYWDYLKSRNWREKIRDYFGDQEKGGKRKKVGIALGVVGVTAVGVAVAFGVEGGFSHHVAHAAANHAAAKGAGTGGHASTGGHNLTNFNAPPHPDTGGNAANLLNIDPNQYTFSVAHQLAPGNETAVIQNTINHYNALNGTNFALTPHDGSIWIMDGPSAINPSQMRDLNELMISLGA